jgi:hypothetical protein
MTTEGIQLLDLCPGRSWKACSFDSWKQRQGVTSADQMNVISPASALLSQNVGMAIFWPPLSADWCAQMPTIVQLTEVAASGIAGRSHMQAIRKA